MTIEQAIRRSQSHNEIVRVERTEENIEALTLICDDHVEGNEEHEFWGQDENGEWRVHAR